jgi:hypothetical protein
MVPGLSGWPGLKTEGWPVAGLPELPPTGPPDGYPVPTPLLVGRFWFSPLADWVSSQSVRCSECCLGPNDGRDVRESDGTHFAIFGKVDLQSFGVILETK